MKLYLIFFLLTGICLSSQAQTGTIDSLRQPPVSYLQQFVHDLNDQNIATDVLLTQYVEINKPQIPEYLDYLIASLDEVRINIQFKDISHISYIPFSETERKKTRDIDLEGQLPKNVFFLNYQKKLVVAILLTPDQNKIASFTLVSKGENKAHFVTY